MGMTKGTFLRVSLGIFLALVSIDVVAGEGPCPVPELISDFVSTKEFHNTTDKVRELMVFGREQRLIYRTEGGEARIAEFGHGSCHPAATDAFALFSNPATVYPLGSLIPRPLPAWFAAVVEVLKTPSRYVGALPQPGIFGTGYQIYQVSHLTPGPVASCRTPRVVGLQPSRGSQYPWAYFHSIRRAAGGGHALVQLFRLQLETCEWQKESSFSEIAAVTESEMVLRFPVHGAWMLTSRVGLLWHQGGGRRHFDLNPTDVVLLDSTLPVVLIRNQLRELQLFFPLLPGVSTVLADAVDFHPSQVGYASRGNKLFIAGSVQGNDRREGIYHFTLKLR